MKNMRFKKFIATFLIVTITITNMSFDAYASIFTDMLKFLSGLNHEIPNYYYLNLEETTVGGNLDNVGDTTKDNVEETTKDNVGEASSFHEENDISEEDEVVNEEKVENEDDYEDEPEEDPTSSAITDLDEDETLKENEDEASEETVEETNSETVDETTSEIVEDTTSETVEETTSETVEETTSDNVEETTKDNVGEATSFHEEEATETTIGANFVSPEENTSSPSVTTEEIVDENKDDVDISTDSEIISTDSELNNDEENIATDSEMLDKENIATDSEMFDKENISTSSDISVSTESEIDLATESEINVATESNVYIASVSKMNWKITKVLIATYSDTDSYVVETVEDRLERLSKKAKVLLTNEKGETKIVEIPIRWKIKNTIDVKEKDTNDVDKVRNNYNVKELVENNNVDLISTSNEILLKEKIKIEKEIEDEIVFNVEETSETNVEETSEENDVEEVQISSINEITSYENTYNDEETTETTVVEATIEPTVEEVTIEPTVGEAFSFPDEATTSESSLTEKLVIKDSYKDFMYIDSIEIMSLDMEDLANNVLLTLTYGDDYFKDTLYPETLDEEKATSSELEEDLDLEPQEKENSFFDFFLNLFTPNEGRQNDAPTGEKEDEATSDNVDEAISETALETTSENVEEASTETDDDILITLLDATLEEVVVESIIYGVIPGLTHGPRMDTTGTKQIGWVAHRICGEQTCSHSVEITLTHTFAEYQVLDDKMTERDYIGTFSNVAFFLNKDTVLRGTWIIESDKESEIGLSICTNGYKLTFGTSSVIRGAVQGRSYNNLGRFNICNCKENTSMISTEVDYKYIDRYGNPDPTVRYTFIQKNTSTGMINVQMKEAKKGEPITRYRDVPLANCGKIGVYGELSFNEIYIENYYNNSISLPLMEEQVPDNPTDTNGTGSLFNAQEIEVFGADFTDVYCIRTNGAIANAYPGALTVQDVKVKNCFVDGNGGAFVANSDRIKLYNVEFNNCNSTVNGGCVYGALPYREATEAELKSYFKNCTFKNSNAGNNGGAVAFNRGGNISFSSCSFEGNTSEFSGGAFFFESKYMSFYKGGELTFDTVTFNNNSARTKNGGALYIEEMGEPCRTRVSLVLSDLTNNRAQGMRVPIYDRKGLDYKEWMRLSKKERDENYWDGKTYAYLGGYGGAIYGKGHVNIYVGETHETNIKNNIANQGGAVCINNSGMSETSYNQLEFMNSLISNNRSLNVNSSGEGENQMTGYMYTSDGGGAIYIMGGAKAHIDKSCEVSQNLNAIYLNGGTLNLEAGSINKNTGSYFIGTCNAASNSIIFNNVELVDHSFKGIKRDFTAENKSYFITTYSFIGNVVVKDNVESDLDGNSFASNIGFSENTNAFDFSKNLFYSDNEIGINVSTKSLLTGIWNEKYVYGYNKGTVLSSMFFLDNGDMKEHKGSDGSREGWRIYRDNEKIYAGNEYKVVHFDYGINDAPTNPKDQYIVDNNVGSLIDMPYELTVNELYQVLNHTFLCFLGHDVAATSSEYYGYTPLFANWDFDYSVLRIDSPINNTLYGAYADDLALFKACGTLNTEACDHANGIQHIERGLTASADIKEKYYRSYIAVGTAPQLYYKYKTHPTQYVFDRDVHIGEGFDEINDQMIINLNGHTMYVDKDSSSVLNLTKDRPKKVRERGTTSEVPTLYETYGANTFITGNVVHGENEEENGTITYEDYADNGNTYKPFAVVNDYEVYFGNVNIKNLNLDDSRAEKAIIYGIDKVATKNEVELDKVNFNNINANVNLVANDKITLRDITVSNNTLKNVLFNIHEASNSILKVYGDNSEIKDNVLLSEVVRAANTTDVTIGNLDVYNNDYDATLSKSLFTLIDIKKGSNFTVDDGTFKVRDNVFKNAQTATNKFAAINATEVIYFGNGAMVATRNTIDGSTVEPYQYCINASSTDTSKFDITKFIFSQIDGTLFDAENAYITIGLDADGATFMNYDLLIYDGWYTNKVKDQNGKQDALFTNTFVKDYYHYGLISGGFDVYKKGMKEATSIRLGTSRVKTNYILHYDYDDAGVVIYSSCVAKGEESQIERPIIDGVTVDIIDDEVVFKRIFWEGPCHDYEVPGTEGFEKNIVYERTLSDVTTIMNNDFNVHGYFAAVHNHATMSEYHNDSIKDYWVEARTEKDLMAAEANIFLSRDITITETLYPTIEGNYSICLNGHKLTFTNGIDWLKNINDPDVNIHIVDCTMNGEINLTDPTVPLTSTLFNIEGGSFYLSSISIIGVTSVTPYLNLGVGASLDMRHVSFKDNAIATTDEHGFIDMFGPAYVEDVTINNNTMNGASSFIYHESATNDIEIKNIHIENNKIPSTNTVGAVIKVDSLGTLTMASGSIINNDFKDGAVIKTSAVNVNMVDFDDISGNSVYEIIHIDNLNTSNAYRTINLENLNITKNSIYGTLYGQDVLSSSTDTKDTYGISMKKINVINNDYFEGNAVEIADYKQTNDKGVYLEDIIIKDNKKVKYTPLYISGVDNSITAKNITVENNIREDENLSLTEANSNAVFINEVKDANITNLIVNNNTYANTVNTDKGSIYITNYDTAEMLKTKVTIDGLTLTNNKNKNSGALKLGPNVEVVATGSVVITNNSTVDSNGSAITMNDYDATLKLLGETTITNNKVKQNGAVYYEKGYLTLGGKVTIDNNILDGYKWLENIVLEKDKKILGSDISPLRKDSNIVVTARDYDNSPEIFNFWNKNTIEAWGTALCYLPDDIFKLDNQIIEINKIADIPWKYYKKGTGDNVAVVLGRDYKALDFKDEDDKVIATQYLANGILTTIDKVIIEGNPNIPLESQIWDAPGVNPGDARTYWDMVNDDYSVLLNDNDFVKLDADRPIIIFNPNAPISPLDKPGATISEYNLLNKDTTVQWVNFAKPIQLKDTEYLISGFTLLGFCKKGEEPTLDEVDTEGYAAPIAIGATISKDEFFPGDNKKAILSAIWKREVYHYTINYNDKTNNNHGSTDANYISGPASGDTFDWKYDTKIDDINALPSLSRLGYEKLLGFSKESNILGKDVDETGASYAKFNNVMREASTASTIKDVTLYAVWQPNKYNITVELNGGKYEEKVTNMTFTQYFDEPFNIDNGDVDSPKGKDGTLLTPIKDNSEFHFYSLDPDIKTSDIGTKGRHDAVFDAKGIIATTSLSDKYVDPHAISRDLTLYAYFTPTIFNITFKGNGGEVLYKKDGKDEYAKEYVLTINYSYIDGGKDFVMPAALRTGYKQGERPTKGTERLWLVGTTSSTAREATKENLFFLEEDSNVVYANWYPIKYTIELSLGAAKEAYNQNKVEGYVPPELLGSVPIDCVYDLPVNLPNIDLLWHLSEESDSKPKEWVLTPVPYDIHGNKLYNNNLIPINQAVKNLATKEDEKVVLVLLWDDFYVIQFDRNDGTGIKSEDNLYVNRNDKVTLPSSAQFTHATDPTYTYNSFTTSPNGGTTYRCEQEVSRLTNADSIILYIKWTNQPTPGPTPGPTPPGPGPSPGGGGVGGGSGGGRITFGDGFIANGTKVEKADGINVIWRVDSSTGDKRANKTNGEAVKGWAYINNDGTGGGYYFFDEDTGIMKKGWIEDKGKHYFLSESDGKLIVGDLYNAGILFSFDKNGALVSAYEMTEQQALFIMEQHNTLKTTGAWEYDPTINKWKFYRGGQDDKHYVSNDWVYETNDHGKTLWYALDNNGNMLTGFINYKGKYYYLSEAEETKGQMQTGLMNINGVTYAFDDSGIYADELSKIPPIGITVLGGDPLNIVSGLSGRWLYDAGSDKYMFMEMTLNDEGLVVEKKLQGWNKIDGKVYYFDKEGNMLTGLVENKGKYYYLSTNNQNIGQLITGEVTINGVKLYFDPSNGELVH